MTPLLFTAREGFIDAAKALLDAGANVNQPREGDQTTALLMAAINGHLTSGSPWSVARIPTWRLKTA